MAGERPRRAVRVRRARLPDRRPAVLAADRALGGGARRRRGRGRTSRRRPPRPAGPPRRGMERRCGGGVRHVVRRGGSPACRRARRTSRSTRTMRRSRRCAHLILPRSRQHASPSFKTGPAGMRPSARRQAALARPSALGLTVRRRAPSDAGRRSSDDRAQGARRSRDRGAGRSVERLSSARHRQSRRRARRHRSRVRTFRSSACAPIAPNRPVLAPTTATRFFLRTLAGNGRETQSRAFLSAPGIEPLYSGVAIRTASAPCDLLPKRGDAGGAGTAVEIFVVGRDLGQALPDDELDVRSMHSAAARRSAVLYEPCRTLPLIARTLIGLPSPARGPR